jgi:hypothetical protein
MLHYFFSLLLLKEKNDGVAGMPFIKTTHHPKTRGKKCQVKISILIN